MLLTLIHEWAHALTMGSLVQTEEDVHGDRFWTVLGWLECAWHRGGAQTASQLEI